MKGTFMIEMNPSRNPAARPSAGCFPVLFTLHDRSGTWAMAEPVGGRKTVLALLIPLLWAAVLASSAQAQNLFVASGGNILDFTPGGGQSTFASGLGYPNGLAFNSAGNLFVTDTGGGNVYEFTPGGARSTFASGLPYPIALAFNSAERKASMPAGTGWEVLLHWHLTARATCLWRMRPAPRFLLATSINSRRAE
jgi:DNA-binding beta-propeller fold protein YncE